MALITKYVREGKLYSRDSLKTIFEFEDNDSFAEFIHPVSYTHLTLPTNREV